MAVSDTSTWNPQLVFIIKQALLNATAIDENDEPAYTLYESALFQLNGLVKSLEATGIHVWTESEGILFPQVGVARYVIGGAAATAHTSDAEAWVRLTVLAAAAQGATTLTLATDEGQLVADGMNIGVVLNDGVTQWTSVDGAPAGDVVTLADPLDLGIDAGAYALAYTTDLVRPLRIPNARLHTLQSRNETPMTVLSRQEYMDLPQKTGSQGTPTQFFYSPQRDTGLLYIWPVPSFSNWAVRFTWYRPLQDFLSPENTADFPQEWLLPLIWNLTKEIAPSYGVPELTWARIKEMADQWALMAINYDRESEPVQFGYEYPSGAW